MIEAKDLTVYYDRHPALVDVSVGIQCRTVTVVLGSNGAGKTTLINTIAGMIPAAAGTISLDGDDITHIPAYKRVKLRLATVPQGRGLFPDMTVEDNLALGAFIVREKAEVNKVLQAVYDLFPRLAERRTQLAETMSGGEQQMLAIGRALMSSPSYLLLDEPSLGLSPILTQELLRAIRKIADGGVGILLVEQNALQSLKVADTAVLIEIGRVVDRGPAAALRDDPRVIESYLGGRKARTKVTGVDVTSRANT